jgi:hypothetical protein
VIIIAGENGFRIDRDRSERANISLKEKVWSNNKVDEIASRD